jgi:nicotinamide N-methyltransferase
MSTETEIPSDFFEEPEGYFKPEPQPTFETYRRASANVKAGQPAAIKVRLVGRSPLWGHLLWNAGKVTTEYLDTHRELTWDKTVLELGAAAALPSLICSLSAKRTVITDYPDPELIENIEINVCNFRRDCKASKYSLNDVTVAGYIWGNDTSELLDLNNGKYDLIILSDLIFNHTEHRKLVTCCNELLSDNGKLFVVFTPHRPKLYHKDMEFFEIANKVAGFQFTKVIEEKLQPMFEEDEETKELRSMVFGYILERS